VDPIVEGPERGLWRHIIKGSSCRSHLLGNEAGNLFGEREWSDSLACSPSVGGTKGVIGKGGLISTMGEGLLFLRKPRPYEEDSPEGQVSSNSGEEDWDLLSYNSKGGGGETTFTHLQVTKKKNFFPRGGAKLQGRLRIKRPPTGLT